MLNGCAPAEGVANLDQVAETGSLVAIIRNQDDEVDEFPGHHSFSGPYNQFQPGLDDAQVARHVSLPTALGLEERVSPPFPWTIRDTRLL
jgi:hypothetical protein